MHEDSSRETLRTFRQGTAMRNTTKNLRNRQRKQKIKKRLVKEARQARKLQRAKTA